MNISDIRITLLPRAENLKAVATITIDDCFVIHDLKVVEGKKGIYVMMPTKQVNSGSFKEIAHPIKTDTRSIIQERVLEAYFALISEQNNEEI